MGRKRQDQRYKHINRAISVALVSLLVVGCIEAAFHDDLLSRILYSFHILPLYAGNKTLSPVVMFLVYIVQTAILYLLIFSILEYLNKPKWKKKL